MVKDLAGNVTDTDAENFISAFAFTPFVTISTNAVVRWYADKALFLGKHWRSGRSGRIGSGKRHIVQTQKNTDSQSIAGEKRWEYVHAEGPGNYQRGKLRQ